MSHLDAMRLVLLYSLRYERHASNDRQGLHDILSRRGVPARYTRVGKQKRIGSTNKSRLSQLVSSMLGYAGKDQRGSDLFGTQSPLAFTKKLLKGLKVIKKCLDEKLY